jgi:hypothetical protein
MLRTLAADESGVPCRRFNLNHRHLNDLYRVMDTKFPGFRSMLASGRLLDQEVLENQSIHLAFVGSLESMAGVSTTGSPFRLKDVFSTTGMPVACSKRSIRRQ